MWLIELFLLNSANLICRSTDISKYFRGSLGIRDNESRLYFDYFRTQVPTVYIVFIHVTTRKIATAECKIATVRVKSVQLNFVQV